MYAILLILFDVYDGFYQRKGGWEGLKEMIKISRYNLHSSWTSFFKKGLVC